MLRSIWDWLVGRTRDSAGLREAEREQMSPAERRLSEESIDDFQADEFTGEHLGGIEPGRMLDEDEPPRH